MLAGTEQADCSTESFNAALAQLAQLPQIPAAYISKSFVMGLSLLSLWC